MQEKDGKISEEGDKMRRCMLLNGRKMGRVHTVGREVLRVAEMKAKGSFSRHRSTRWFVV